MGKEVQGMNRAQRESWVDDLLKVFKGMLEQSKANDATLPGSEEMRAD